MELHRLDGIDGEGIDHMDITETFTSQESDMLLNGIHDADIAYEILDEDGNVILYADAEENIYVIDGLGGFFKKIGRGLKKFTRKVGKYVVKPVVRTFNRFLNPATILLRNGFLLAMKSDMMKVARRLRYGYLSPAQAKKMGLDMRKYGKLRKAVEKAEKIYRVAGGRGRNLRKAILTGKGNKDRKVPLSGFSLGSIDGGPTIYNDPFEKFVIESDLDTFEAFLNNEVEVDGLGAVATGTAVAAASGAVASVATVLSKIGNIFGKANKVVSQVSQVKQQAQNLFQKPRRLPPRPLPRPLPRPIPRTTIRPTRIMRGPARRVITANKPLPAKTNAAIDDKQSWIERNKTPLLIGAGVLVAGSAIAIAVKSNTKKSAKPVSGVPQKNTKQRKPKNKGRDALGRFTKGHTLKKKKTRKRKTTKKLIPKALL
ncbi:hypothetical protein [Aquimarina mytili]|uniref:Uncharacterized protein n=1 Tax=Aquimarina mytili TaxID=874423 RepID=A0A936ZX71_9FLAO|nr:hypothetical protein [Aquimarina mytili]MBL0683595.1 hypothetical protein [Aquimarina mytili]